MVKHILKISKIFDELEHDSGRQMEAMKITWFENNSLQKGIKSREKVKRYSGLHIHEKSLPLLDGCQKGDDYVIDRQTTTHTDKAYEFSQCR